MASNSVPFSSASKAFSNHGFNRRLAVAWSILGSFNLRICSSRDCSGLVLSDASLFLFLDWSLHGEGVERLLGDDILSIQPMQLLEHHHCTRLAYACNNHDNSSGRAQIYAVRRNAECQTTSTRSQELLMPFHDVGVKNVHLSSHFSTNGLAEAGTQGVTRKAPLQPRRISQLTVAAGCLGANAWRRLHNGRCMFLKRSERFYTPCTCACSRPNSPRTRRYFPYTNQPPVFSRGSCMKVYYNIQTFQDAAARKRRIGVAEW